MDRVGEAINFSDEVAVKRQILEVEGDVRRGLEKWMAERELPEVSIRKGDLRGTNTKKRVGDRGMVLPEDVVKVRPVKHVDQDGENDWWKVLDWEFEKVYGEEKKLPEISCEVVDKKEWSKYQQRLSWGYASPTVNETAYVFRNEENELVGWCVGTVNGTNFGMRFIGVNDGVEGKGYGSAMLSDLETRYKSIGLTVHAFVRRGDWEEAQEKLYRFYAKNGFRMAGNGMSWNSQTPNFEELKPGGKLKSSDEVIIGGDNVSVGTIMERYFDELKKMGKLDEVMGEMADATRSWMALKKEEDRLYT